MATVNIYEKNLIICNSKNIFIHKILYSNDIYHYKLENRQCGMLFKRHRVIKNIYENINTFTTRKTDKIYLHS